MRLTTTLKRLNMLRRVAVERRDQDALLDMESWADITDKNELKEKDSICGTSCCMFGYATFDPEFRKLGLSGSIQFYNGYDSIEVDTIEELNNNLKELNIELNKNFNTLKRVFHYRPLYKNKEDYEASTALFGIDMEPIFSVDSYGYPDGQYSTEISNLFKGHPPVHFFNINFDNIIDRIDIVIAHIQSKIDAKSAKKETV